jgi:hypothetical protein
MDRPVHAPPPPGPGTDPQCPEVPREPEPEPWPEEEPEVAFDDSWPSESDDDEVGWEEPECEPNEPEDRWPDEGAGGPGVELADEVDPEAVTEEEDGWAREDHTDGFAERS